jgi:hypothetical protein
VALFLEGGGLMARGAQKAAMTNTGIGQDNAKALNGRATDVNNVLFPQLQQRAEQGLTPGEKATMNTASQQSLGGSNAGAVGSADLYAARTRNAGAMQPALDESVRSGQRQNSTNALNTEGKSLDMKTRALAALQGLYGTDVQGGNQALGESNNAIGQWTNASNSTNANALAWAKFAAQALSGAATGFAGGGAGANG